MVVYLVAAIRKMDDRSYTILELCTRFIMGIYDHVEIAFVRDESVYSFYITRKSGFVSFREKSFDNLLKDYKVDWYELTTISTEKEPELEARCHRMLHNPKQFSWLMEMFSAFPYPDIHLAYHWFQYVEPGAKVYRDQDVGLDSKKHTYCGALSGEILGLDNPTKLTATDVVYFCIRDFGAVQVKNPIQKEETSLLSYSGIVRSTNMV